jgi:PAS domain S-box-containing protein
VGFFFAGAALFLLRDEKAVATGRRFLGLACAGVPLLIGGLTLVEQAFGVDLRFHGWMFSEALTPEGPFAGRPVFPIPVCLALLGFALTRLRSRTTSADALVLVALAIGLLALIGYLYHSVPFSRVEPQRPVPVMAALLVVTIALGCLSARPEGGMLDVVTSRLAGGIMARRLLPAAILLPFGLGLLRLVGQRAGLYGTESGLALFATLNITVFVALVYSSARRLDEAAARREDDLAALAESERSFHTLLDAAPFGLILMAPDGGIALANATAEGLFGYETSGLNRQPIEALVPERFRAGHVALRQACEEEERPRLMGTGLDLPGLRRDGGEFPVEIRLRRVDLPEGRFTLVSVADVTERKRADQEIRSLNATLERRVLERTRQLDFERARWQAIVEGIADEVWICDARGRMSLVNRTRVTGLELEAIKDESIEEVAQRVDMLTPDGQPRAPEEAPLLRALRGEIVHGEEVLRHRESGEMRHRDFSAAPLRDAEGAITGAVAIVRDITDHKRAEEGLRRFELLATHGKDIVLFVRREDGRILEANAAAVQAYGYARDELLALSVRDIRAPETRDLVAEQMAQADAGGTLFETVHQRKDGSAFPVEVSAQGATIGGVRALISIVRDITERKRAQAELSAALRHREALLKEIHHRVKNNLQVISSLLRLQAASLDDSRLRELLADSQRRVRAMALIHEQLYRSSDLARIDFEGYVLNLVSFLRRSSAPAGANPEIQVAIEEVSLGMEQAMPLGLLVNELVSNSLKHAFPPGARAEGREISIAARRHPPDTLTLTVGDNGVGLPDEVDIEHSSSMGLQLVRSFVVQLQGQLAVRRKPGTAFTVTIPETRG